MYTFLDILSTIFKIIGILGALGFIGTMFNPNLGREGEAVRTLCLFIIVVFLLFHLGVNAIIDNVCDNVVEKENMITTLNVIYIGEDLGNELYENEETGEYYLFTEEDISSKEKHNEGPKFKSEKISAEEAEKMLVKIAAKKKD